MAAPLPKLWSRSEFSALLFGSSACPEALDTSQRMSNLGRKRKSSSLFRSAKARRLLAKRRAENSAPAPLIGVRSPLRESTLEASVVFLMMAGGPSSVTNPQSWHDLLVSAEGSLGLQVHVSRELRSPLPEWLVPFAGADARHPPASSGWGSVGLVFEELLLLHRALFFYPRAELFCVVSGDSVPLRAAGEYSVASLRARFGGASFCFGTYGDRVDGMLWGMQWKLLDRSWASCLSPPGCRDAFVSCLRHHNTRYIEAGHTCSIPDEWFVAHMAETISGKRLPECASEYVMWADMVRSETRVCAKCPREECLYHAHEYTTQDALDEVVRRARRRRKDHCLFLRKVGPNLVVPPP